MRTVSRLAAPVLSVAALCASANAFALDAYDSASGQLSITTVSVNGVAYQGVTVLVTSYTLLGVDGGTPGADTFDPVLSLLSMGSVLFQGNVYNNVRVRINGFTLLTGSPGGGTPTSGTTGTTGTTGTSGTSGTTGTSGTSGTTSTPITPGAGVVAYDSCNIPGFQSAVMTAINAARKVARVCSDSSGTISMPAALSDLNWNSNLFDSAAGHSADMAINNYFAHVGPDGLQPWDRMSAAGYGWSAAAENIAVGQGSISEVMAAWLGDYGHCKNIMSNSYADVGMACVMNKNSTPYWTMDLGHH